MSDPIEIGGYFSRNYFQRDKLLTDSARLRLRIATYLKEFTADQSAEFGRYIQQEVGIKVLKQTAYTAYVSWDEVLHKCDVHEFLDIVTAICRFCPTLTREKNGIRVKYDFPSFVDRAFREEAMAFRVDEKGGIHPFVDIAFSSSLAELVRHLSDQRLVAAKESIEQAERALLATSYDGRTVVRSIFDAVENTFKQICPKSNQLNKANITNELQPIILSSMANNPHESRATSKLIDGLIAWADSGHNFRHDPGQPEPNSPSMLLATTYFAQGMSYVRWLADILVKQKSA